MTTRIRKLLPRDKRDELFGYSAQARADRAAVAEEDFLCRQYPRTKDFILAQRFDLRFTKRDHRDRVTNGVENFKAVTGFLAGKSFVVFDDGGEVAPAKSIFRNIGF